MSLDRIGPCLNCGTRCEGWTCSFSCEIALLEAKHEEAQADNRPHLATAIRRDIDTKKAFRARENR